MSITLSDQQAACVRSVADWFKNVRGQAWADYDAPVFCIGGYAGSGKSTILPFILHELGLDSSHVAFGAPTANAAKVMTKKLNAYGISASARTIHSLIYVVKPTKIEMLEKQIAEQKAIHQELLHTGGSADRLQTINVTIKLLESDLDKALDINHDIQFSLNPNSDLRNCRLVIVDEGSMVGTAIADDLRKFSIPILVLGDPGQLPPVQDDPGFHINSPDFMLSEIHRQALDSPIIRLSFEAREGRMLKVKNYGDGVRVVDRRNDDATFNLDIDAQIIVGTHRKRWNITQKLRKEMGFLSTGPCKGEPLVVCKNSRNIPGLVNGSAVTCMQDIGNLEDGRASFLLPIKDENNDEHSIYVMQGLFEEHFLKSRGSSSVDKRQAYRAKISNEHVDWGWTLTCHKAQGSQWPNVVLHDESGAFRDSSANWLYTGITRAEKELTVVI